MAVKIIESVREGEAIITCDCGYRAFTDSHGKAACPKCGEDGSPKAEVIEVPVGKRVGAK